MKNMLLFLLWSFFYIELKYNIKWGVIIRWKSFWIGCHYSDYNKRYCLNILPCITVWWIKNEGNQPSKIL